MNRSNADRINGKIPIDKFIILVERERGLGWKAEIIHERTSKFECSKYQNTKEFFDTLSRECYMLMRKKKRGEK